MTGRIDGSPSEAWHEEVLAPQFAYDVDYLLGHYIAIEKVLLLEYRRMGLVDSSGAAAIAERLAALTPQAVRADRQENLSDISFAIERFIAAGPRQPFAAWHVDRSRNDLQACAQLMSCRERVHASADDLLTFARAVIALAERSASMPMPGYTHAQAAQIITPGFYFAALSAETLTATRRLLHTHDEINACPLGAGAMAGQELAWDRDRMAGLLGFSRAWPHALAAVASRGWALAVSSDLANFAVTLSRFATDLIAWSGSEHGFLDLPDDLAGISAAMPQKRNFPVIERIRGRCAHVTGCALTDGIPWRTAQVIAGSYVKKALDAGLSPGEPDGALLAALASEHGFRVADPAPMLAAAFSVDHGLNAKRSAGSAHPAAVGQMLAAQARECELLAQEWAARRSAVAAAADRVGALLRNDGAAGGSGGSPPRASTAGGSGGVAPRASTGERA